MGGGQGGGRLGPLARPHCTLGKVQPWRPDVTGKGPQPAEGGAGDPCHQPASRPVWANGNDAVAISVAAEHLGEADGVKISDDGVLAGS
jgi:hypothetical protein